MSPKSTPTKPATDAEGKQPAGTGKYVIETPRRPIIPDDSSSESGCEPLPESGADDAEPRDERLVKHVRNLVGFARGCAHVTDDMMPSYETYVDIPLEVLTVEWMMVHCLRVVRDVIDELDELAETGAAEVGVIRKVASDAADAMVLYHEIKAAEESGQPKPGNRQQRRKYDAMRRRVAQRQYNRHKPSTSESPDQQLEDFAAADGSGETLRCLHLYSHGLARAMDAGQCLRSMFGTKAQVDACVRGLEQVCQVAHDTDQASQAWAAVRDLNASSIAAAGSVQAWAKALAPYRLQNDMLVVCHRLAAILADLNKAAETMTRFTLHAVRHAQDVPTLPEKVNNTLFGVYSGEEYEEWDLAANVTRAPRNNSNAGMRFEDELPEKALGDGVEQDAPPVMPRSASTDMRPMRRAPNVTAFATPVAAYAEEAAPCPGADVCDSLQRAAEDAATPHHHAHVHRAGAVTMGGDTIEMGRRALGTIKLPAYVKLPYFRVTKVPTGANTHESPVDFIDEMELVLTTYADPATSDSWARLLPLQVTLSARHFVKTRVATCDTWEQAKLEFIEHFELPGEALHRKQQFWTISQDTAETVVDFNDRYMKDLEKSRLEVADGELIDHYILALRDPFRSALQTQQAHSKAMGQLSYPSLHHAQQAAVWQEAQKVRNRGRGNQAPRAAGNTTNNRGNARNQTGSGGSNNQQRAGTNNTTDTNGTCSTSKYSCVL